MIKSNFRELEEGDFLSEIQYYKVLKIKKGGIMSDKKVTVVNERGQKMDISARIVEDGLFSASQVRDTMSVTRTEMISILEQAGETVFTVNFHKKPNLKELMSKFNESAITVKSQKAMGELILGDERTMCGYLLATNFQGTGRLSVRDMESPEYPKQVDPRTLNWLILRNIKYTLK